jgi:hypothetical protein
MATKTETAVYAGEFIASEANGTLSRETGTIKSGENVVAGEILEREVATGKWIACTGALDSDSGLVNLDVGIAYAAVDATAGDVDNAVIFERLGEVVDSHLTYPAADSDGTEVTAVIAALDLKDIRVL